jgi:protein-disulfide isomerase
MSKRFVIILAALVVVFGGLLVFNKKKANAPTDGAKSSSAKLTEHKVEGSSGVVLTEYGDFQCPACGMYHPVIQQLKEKYKGKVTFQFRHFPLTEIHKNALVSARAAEAAGLQGKFFEMHDKLYEGQQAWKDETNPTPTFEQYAKAIGLDVAKFRTDMKSEQTNNAVQADRADAKKKKYASTPTFVLNGKKIDAPESLDAFTKVLDDALKAKN